MLPEIQLDDDMEQGRKGKATNAGEGRRLIWGKKRSREIGQINYLIAFVGRLHDFRIISSLSKKNNTNIEA